MRHLPRAHAKPAQRLASYLGWTVDAFDSFILVFVMNIAKDFGIRRAPAHRQNDEGTRVMPIPATLRFHGGTKHARGKFWPAMVALVTRGTDGAPLAIHRTFMSGDGTSKAPIEPAKMMLGPCRGGAVRLGPITDRLLVAEGIENALSAMQATGQAAWAALSTSGLRTLELPVEARDVVVLADGDEPGAAARHDAARRWKRRGRRVRIARPPRGFDFNDVLLGRTFGHEEGAA